MGLIRNIVILGLGFLVVKLAQRMLANVHAQQEKVTVKVNETAGRIPKLKLDPITGIYRPEV